MSDNRSRKVIGGIIAVAVLLLGWQIYSNWPTVIKGTGPVSELEFRSDWVSVTLKEGATVSDVATMRVFERFTFDTSGYQAEETLGQSDRWEKDGDASFHEYIRPMGRLRFYEAPEYGKEGSIEGMINWVEAVPNQLFADQFFNKAVAKHLDLSKVTQNVYIPVPAQHCYISVTLDGPRVSRIAWIPRYY